MLIQGEVGLLSILQDTGTISRIVLLVLLVFSVWSWGIIISKALLLKKVRVESETFWKIFRKGRTFSEIGTACETLRFTPLVPVFNSGAVLASKRTSTGNLAESNVAAIQRSMQRTMQRAAAAQLTILERHLTFLATTAAAAPFVGLLGTVIGVLTSFLDLSVAESATLKAVGPGIAEALLATAFGLFAAIPAVIAYNQFVTQLRGIGGQLDDLQSEMMGIAEGVESLAGGGGNT